MTFSSLFIATSRVILKFIVTARRNGMRLAVKKAVAYIARILNVSVIRLQLRLGIAVSALLKYRAAPQLTYIVPVYDRTSMVRDALNSILSQIFDKLEVIIVCDGSPDETRQVVKEFQNDSRVRVFHYPYPSGTATRGRNKGILEASGEYIAFLDSDDLALPNRSRHSVMMLERGCDVAYSWVNTIVDGSRSIPLVTDGGVFQSPTVTYTDILSGRQPFLSATTVRRALFERYGFFKPEMKFREDHELWLRFAYYGAKFSSIPLVLTQYRVHDGNNELNFINDDLYWLNKVFETYKQIPPKPKKIAFLVPGLGISGGIAIVFRHASMLINSGHDVLIINTGEEGNASWYPRLEAPIYHIASTSQKLFNNIDLLFATGWQTVSWLPTIESKRKLYFVQADERDFVGINERHSVERTYHTKCEYVTEARWIRRMLLAEFNQRSVTVPKGIDLTLFNPNNPLDASPRKRMRILLEGPLILPRKGVAEAYNAISELDCDIWLVSSAGKPPTDWRIDRFFESVPFHEMHQIYSSCDILIKMSKVEGIFGPPMEAMACGCAVVTSKVNGFDEYILHEYNALVVEKNDIVGARLAVYRLMTQPALRKHLTDNGHSTARAWTWDESHRAMLEIVDGPSVSLNAI